ncbi:hypothetical protein B296_00054258 [Ensete ventricosum]|uniref:Uncharacterized protein n=1 Tax=Ensete ventricosum TaxID=4639 RepID=A0A426Y4S2_ENSVE|nr:hypothetical protein B296_00054258 [Ensete ventricosum]
MQRAAQKDEKPKEVEKVTPGADFGASPSPARRWYASLRLSLGIVIMDGDPHPAALKGRMSFQSFNPSIDVSHEKLFKKLYPFLCTPKKKIVLQKLNEEAANNQQHRSGTSNNGGISKRCIVSCAATDSRTGSSKNVSDLDLKRKEPESETDKTTPRKLPKTPAEVGGGQSRISNDRRASHKQQKHEKLDWNVLRPPKPGNRG